MIITRTPFRVSFAGGGTDIPGFYRTNGHGAVISAAIRKYMYIVIHPYFQDKIRIKYSKTEDVENIEEIEHPIVKECLRRLGVSSGIEIASFADVASGTGLGSSSAFTVGLLNALYAYKGQMVSKKQLAEEACEIEIDILKEPIGKQDQYATAYGGVNHIIFNADKSVEVYPLVMSSQAKEKLENCLHLYYVGGSRKAGEILKEQQSNFQKNKSNNKYLSTILEHVELMKEGILKGSAPLIGETLHEGWQQKKKLASEISNEIINLIYKKAMKHGVKGGKLLGAGGAGFLLFCHNDHTGLAQQLGCKTLPFQIDTQGSTVIHYE